MKISELTIAYIFCLLLIAGWVFFIGFLTGKEYNQRQNQKQWTEFLEAEQAIIEDSKCQPYFPDFRDGQGIVIYPETGLMVIDFPDNIKILIEKEGCE